MGRVAGQSDSQLDEVRRPGTRGDYERLDGAEAARDDTKIFVAAIRVAVRTPENILEHLAGLPDQPEQIAQLGMEIILASLRARWTAVKKHAL